jgi:type II secretory pathway predicted ATPase ExeA
MSVLLDTPARLSEAQQRLQDLSELQLADIHLLAKHCPEALLLRFRQALIAEKLYEPPPSEDAMRAQLTEHNARVRAKAAAPPPSNEEQVRLLKQHRERALKAQRHTK